MRTLQTTGLVIALALAVTACGEDEAATGDLDLIAPGSLTVCTDAPYEPFEFQDENDEWTGFDMDLLHEITDNLGLELAVTVQPFDGIWLAPAAGTCDLVASAMTITEERAENALFSDPYFDADQSLLIRAGDEGTIASLDDLAGMTIAVQTGTTGADYAEENAPEDSTIQEFDEPAAMFLALQSSEVDAILQDFPVNAERALVEPDSFALTETFPTGEQYGFATSLDNTELIDAVNEQLATVTEDGTYDEVFATYFGEPVE